MRQRGQSTIIAAIIIGIIAVAGLYIVLPRVSGTSGPSIPGITEKKVKVSLSVDVSSPSWDWGDVSVDIKDQTVQTKTFSELMVIGPLWINDVYNAEIVCETIKDGHVIDSKTRNVELDEGVWKTSVTETLTFEWLTLGKEGSGTYTIKVSAFDEQGDLITADTVTRSI